MKSRWLVLMCVCALAVTGTAAKVNAEDIVWTDFSGLVPYDLTPDEVALCDGKTVEITITQNTTPFVQIDGGTIGYPFFTEEHSVFGNVNDIDYLRFRTRAASAAGNFNNAAPNSYMMEWTFPMPLDHRNFFVVGQLLQYNVATITATDSGDNDVTDQLLFEQLAAVKGIYTFYEPLTWDGSTGVLKKAGTSGSNSKYGFFRIPEGVEVAKVVIALSDTGQRGSAADEVNYGIGCVVPSCETDLIADGGSAETATDVGEVEVFDNGDGTWDVIYKTTGTWEITQVHLDVACDANDFPQTGSGNPKVGQFCYQDTIPEGTQSYTVAGIGPEFCHDGFCDCPQYFAAHAVVVDTASCDDAGAVMYGTERYTGDLYEIDLETGTATFISETGPFATDADMNQPNGAAFDPANGRLYYSSKGTEGSTPSDLFFYDLGTGVEQPAGDLDGFDVGASFYGGAYYYIPNGTDDVNLVTLNPDGTLAAETPVWTDFTGAAGKIYRFGDIAISVDGILYGSTNGTSGSSGEFFTIDLATGVYTMICDDTQAIPGCMHSLQLAFGSDGTLYAHSAGSGEFYAVDLSNGSGTAMGKVTGSDNGLFTDLASGELCILRTETAWGDGTEFPGKSWATWFECENCD